MYIRDTIVLQNGYKIMSTTIRPILLDHHWKDDGTNFYRVLITHNRAKRYIKTNVLVTRQDLNRSGNVTSLAILAKIDKLITEVRAIVSEINMYQLEAMTVAEVADYVEKKMKGPEKFVLDFVEFGHKVAGKKSEGNAKTYQVALNALVRFFGGRHPDISEITVRNLRAFEEYINNESVVKVDWRSGKQKTIRKKKGGRAASLYMSNLRHIYKCARLEFNDPDLGLFPIPTDPFEYYSVPKTPAPKHRDIPVEVIQKMIDTRKNYTGRQRMAVDAFLISFGLCGINAADMFSCDRPKKSGVLHYCRQKTTNRRDDGAEMFVKIHPCIKEIMKEYSDAHRCFDYYLRYADKDVFTTALNQGLKLWQTKEKVESFTFYSARHSWATIARSKRCDIDAKIVTAGLCHVDAGNKVDDIYIKFDWEQLWDAQEKILNVFNWQ